jgi:uncharacterized protein YjiS (DUF1127 family)
MLRTSIRRASAAEGLAAAPRGRFRLIRVLRNAVRLAAMWNERARQRDALAELDDRQLRDLGLTRAQAVRESGMPFWRTSR